MASAVVHRRERAELDEVGDDGEAHGGDGVVALEVGEERGVDGGGWVGGEAAEDGGGEEAVGGRRPQR